VVAPQLKSSDAGQQGGHKVNDPMKLAALRRERKSRRSSWRGIWRVKSSLMDMQVADAGLEGVPKKCPGQLHEGTQGKSGDVA
jgi:hypothetical protein